MRRQTRHALSVLAGLLLFPGLAAASGFGLFQHGGRGAAQAGAFTARASDPSALTYNPAAIARLEGFQLQAGLDFNNATDKYESETRTNSSRHVINFPPAVYMTWHAGGGSPFALGIGVDAPFWNDLNWDPALFPGRFLTRRSELELFEVHPVLAWEVDESWSVGGGVRYLFGGMRTADNGVVEFTSPAGPRVSTEVLRDADADVDGLGWDFALHYARPSWGWGAVLRSSVEVEGSGDAIYRPRDVPAGIPGLDAFLAAQLARGSASQSFELPYELRGGIWWAPYPELRLEADSSFQRWSGLDDSHVTFSTDPLGDGPTIVRRRGWDDTLALRLGLEGEVTEAFWLQAGFAWEPSPVPTGAIEPGLPRGDAMVYAAGFSYNFPHISFDVGYSFHDHESRSAPRQEERNPGVVGRYSAGDQVWSASARWRF